MTSEREDLAIWPAVVSAALLGTDRAPIVVASSGTTLGSACTSLARDADAARALLRVAAATSVYRRCGWIPPRATEPALQPAPTDVRPISSPAAAAMLRRMLRGEHQSLLVDWLELAIDRERRAPAGPLP